MATLALAAVGAAAGGALLPTGISVLGATITGATIGSQIGALAGSYVDQALFGSSGEQRTVEGPRLSDLHVTSSTEGSPVPRIYGRLRLGGQLIWADAIEEEVVTSAASGNSGGGKGGASAGGASGQQIEYRYYGSFAVAIAEGPVTGLGRVWADGQELDLSRLAYRVHKGDESQATDSLIEARFGTGHAPAYRGTAYIVFERLALAPFGNRLPQLSFEVYRATETFGEDVRGVVMIPGSGEFVYATTPVVQTFGGGSTRAENVHTRQGGTDWQAAADQLQETLPNAASISLVVSWFGTDLRAGDCEIKPGVEQIDKTTAPVEWQVAGVTRGDAYLVSRREGRAAYGGTPSDASVVAAIRDLKERGLEVVLTPFILMDVPQDNALPDPYGGAAQPAYPWRGRITCHPAAGQPGTADKTAVAAVQIAAFVGTAGTSDFSIEGDEVFYSGPAEWSYRRMVLHQAHLAKAAGGVTAFVIGTELRGLTQVRANASAYPFVAALTALASDVKAVLGPATKVIYAADWSEYFGHQPGDGSGDVYFHLDPLWASPAIDAIGIDLYWPLADWRDGRSHLDYLAGARSIHELSYLRGNVRGGEGYDWYYASMADRDQQLRTPIADGAGKPWVFRYKDITSWWLNAHYDRPGGVEAAAPTAWVPQSKPFWIMELGCPAADKGANQPNVFVDPKSSESALPYYSRGVRDDLMQRRFLRAFTEAFDPEKDGYLAGINPVSVVYGGRMLDTGRIHFYTWDARPYPAFPSNAGVWGDGENWRLGHWLNGRFASAPLAETVARILDDYGFSDYEVGGLAGIVPGFLIDRVMAPRDALQPLGLAYFFDALESGGRIAFRHRATEPPVAALTLDGLVESNAEAPLATLIRGQETDLPASAKITFISTRAGYRQAVAEARRLTGASGRVAQADLPIVLDADQAAGIAETWLFEAWAARERAAFQLPPSQLAVEPGDTIALEHDAAVRLFRVTDTGEHGAREIEARGIDPEVYGVSPVTDRADGSAGSPVLSGQPLVEFMDLPLLRGDEPPEDGYIAAAQNPWPGAIALYGSPETAGFSLRGVVNAPATIGITLDPLPPGPEGRLDHANRIRVKTNGATLASVTRLQLLGGQNAAAIRNAGGDWEIMQFETAELVAAETYELSGLLRGQSGTEVAMAGGIAAGAVFVSLNGAPARVDLTLNEIGLPYIWRYGPASRALGDASYGERQHAFHGAGLRPLSPVHVRGVRTDGDLNISWTRRTRVGGDGWEAAEVPLAEDFEGYEIDILDGSGVVRTISTMMPAAAYTATEQIADFGSLQSAVDVRVCQLSAAFGRGTARAAAV